VDVIVEAEDQRVARLLAAQAKAVVLFDEVIRRQLLAPGISERQASDAIRDLAVELLGIDRFWHKRIVRAGENTLQPYDENPPDRVIAADDIVFFDFGPIFEQWEADFGRTYVLGDDPRKHALCQALPVVWHASREFFDTHPDVTGEEFYEQVVHLARQAGWEFGGTIAGHLVGQFPHVKIAGDDIESYIAPGNHTRMRNPDRNGQACHWILEVHLVDRTLRIGGFVEELLDIGTPALPRPAPGHA
jgi:Xaa-Pro aminopeptidase